MFKRNLLFRFILFGVNFEFLNGDGSYVNIPNIIRYPYSATQAPFMGLFLAISLPLDLPNYNIFFSYNMEANYVLPSNESEFTYPPLLEKRSLQSRRFWDRKYFYDILEFKIKSHGYPGRDCLLRAICETSLYSSQHTGILGDLLHILLTPSTSKDDYLLKDYGKAERYGKKKKVCDKYVKKCTTSLLDLISHVSHYTVS